MSGCRTSGDRLARPCGQIPQSLKHRRLLLSSASKASLVEDNRFPAADGRAAGTEVADSVVVNTPVSSNFGASFVFSSDSIWRFDLLKRKPEHGDNEASELSELKITPGSAEVVNNPLVRLTKKSYSRPKVSKHNKSDVQDSLSNAGSPSCNALTNVGTCRYDSSLGLLTKRFINLLKHAQDGTLDLNKAAETLVAEVEKLVLQENQLDECISKMQERMRVFTETESNQKLLYLTIDDIKSVPCFQNQTLIAIKAPHGTTLEVPDPDEFSLCMKAFEYPHWRYRIVIRSTMGPIDIYLVSKFEKNFEEMSSVETPLRTDEMVSSGSLEAAILAVATDESKDEKMEFKNQDRQGCLDASSSEDTGCGMTKIVPSEIDTDADYWLQSDFGASITDLWNTPQSQWDRYRTDDFTTDNTSTAEHQTPCGTIDPPTHAPLQKL
ncbi:hypothetical protein ZIOFF_001060 [Zingiber officinale]|uniref:E2F/DP family winged-helix DNA-binding domain-containing protein n=1 Tax=Zingiber officinale TaxID=94328 RepID=A0A8J5HY49_ZINOF|nr:hypothetical protein ZIOFF_001060 [Zingiber officinale]